MTGWLWGGGGEGGRIGRLQREAVSVLQASYTTVHPTMQLLILVNVKSHAVFAWRLTSPSPLALALPSDIAKASWGGPQMVNIVLLLPQLILQV